MVSHSVGGHLSGDTDVVLDVLRRGPGSNSTLTQGWAEQMTGVSALSCQSTFNSTVIIESSCMQRNVLGAQAHMIPWLGALSLIIYFVYVYQLSPHTNQIQKQVHCTNELNCRNIGFPDNFQARDYLGFQFLMHKQYYFSLVPVIAGTVNLELISMFHHISHRYPVLLYFCNVVHSLNLLQALG